MAEAASRTLQPLAPTGAGERITTLDAIRGVAVLGILAMNAASFGLEPAAYWNISAGGIDTWLDWAIGGAGEIFVDQKFMGLFSMLFGAGIVLFFERAVVKGRRGGWLSFWRNLLLLGIGILRMALALRHLPQVAAPPLSSCLTPTADPALPEGPRGRRR